MDATSGNDRNNGLSESTAWKTIAKVNASSFIPGDSILFKRGETWREGLAVPSSGSNGHPITFGAYGSGNKPKITGANSILGGSGDWANQGSNIWRKNIGTITPNVVIFDATVTGNNNASLAAKYNWRYRSPNLDVYSVGNPTSYYTSIEAGQRNYAIQVWVKSYITIQNLDLRGANTRTIDIYSTNDHHKIQNCNIQNTFMGIGASDTVTGNITIENNEIHDTVEYGILFVRATALNNMISGNTIYNIGGKGGASSNECGIYATFSNSTITQNTIHNCGSHANTDHAIYLTNSDTITISRNKIYTNLNVGIKVSNSDTVNVYYNLLYDNGVGIRVEIGTPSAINIYNNTIANNGSNGQGIRIDLGDNIIVKNNIVYNITYGVDSGKYSLVVDAAVTNFSSDYNLYYHPSGGNLIYWHGTPYRVAEFNSETGNEAHGLSKNPGFVNASANDFRLVSSSPCKDAGYNVGLTQDYGGSSVPMGSGVDIGALEYVIAATKGLRIVSP